MSIGQSYKTNFDTLREAAANGDLCLLEVYDRITGEPAVMLCAGFMDEEEHANLVPLAQMCAFNPYEKFVVEKEDLAKYYAVGESVARTEDKSFLNTIRDVPYVEGDLAKGYAILLDHLGDEERARAHTRLFVDEVLSKVGDEWSISAKELDSWVHHVEHPEEDKEEADDKGGEAPATGKAPETGT